MSKPTQTGKNFAPATIQVNTKTLKRRYGFVFPFVRDLAAAFRVKSQTILSFGCSSGAEMLTLRELFRDARIVGVDINESMLEQARQVAAEDGNMTVLHADEFWAANDPIAFDLVFCMSVLCVLPFEFIDKPRWTSGMQQDDSKHRLHAEFAEGLQQRMPFKSFQRLMAQFDARMHAGSIFVLFNSNYRLLDTVAGRNYQRVIIPGCNLETQPKFKKNLQPVFESRFSDFVYVKMV